MINFTKYEKYKDSGLDWLSEIPENWELQRIKAIGVVNGRVGWKALKASEYVDKSDYFFLATPNIKDNEIDFVNVNYLTKERYEESPEIMLEIDDILLTKDGSTLGTVNIVKHLPSKGTVNSSIAVLRFNKNYFNKFVFYQIKSNYLQNVINLKKDGAGVPHLFQKDINNFVIISPPIQTQKAIAEYLDEKTANIDKKIELLQAKKEKYQELRKTIINEAVTKGIDKTVELKNSGVEWLGKIPKHWEVKRGKDIFIEESRKGYGDQPLLAASQKLGVVLKSKLEQRSMEATKNFDDFKHVKKGEFVISLRSFEGGIEIAHDSGIISPAYTVFSLDKNLSNDYFKHLLKSDQFICFLRSFITGIRDGQTIRFKEVGNMPFPTAPKFEQKRIADYLDENTSKIDEIVLAIDKNIEVLNEFRKTLINDVVTGKIKVVSSENTPYERTAITG